MRHANSQRVLWLVIPAKAGTQGRCLCAVIIQREMHGVPALAGMTGENSGAAA